jgi:hypothetical protein
LRLDGRIGGLVDEERDGMTDKNDGEE